MNVAPVGAQRRARPTGTAETLGAPPARPARPALDPRGLAACPRSLHPAFRPRCSWPRCAPNARLPNRPRSREMAEVREGSKLGNSILDWGKGSAFGAETHCGATGRISAVSPAERCASLSCLSGPAGAQGWSGYEGLTPRLHPPTVGQLRGPTGVWPLPPPRTKAACPRRGRGRGAAPRLVPTPLLPPRPLCGNGSPRRGRGRPRLGRGRGLDPFQRSFAQVAPGAF